MGAGGSQEPSTALSRRGLSFSPSVVNSVSLLPSSPGRARQCPCLPPHTHTHTHSHRPLTPGHNPPPSGSGVGSWTPLPGTIPTRMRHQPRGPPCGCRGRSPHRVPRWTCPSPTPSDRHLFPSPRPQRGPRPALSKEAPPACSPRDPAALFPRHPHSILGVSRSLNC